MTNAKRGRPIQILTDAEKLAKFDHDTEKKRQSARNSKRNQQNVTLEVTAVAQFDAYIDQTSEALGIRLTKSQALTYLLNQVTGRTV